MSWRQRGPNEPASRRRCGRALIVASLWLLAPALAPVLATAEPSHLGPYGTSSYTDAQRAQELYLDGLEKLEAGHLDFAQRTFEQLIALYPDSQAAGLARSELAGLYRRDRGGEPAPLPETASDADRDSGSPAIDVPRTTGAISAPSVGDTAAARALERLKSPAWEQELNRAASAQTRLRKEAGDRVFFSPSSAELGTRARIALATQAQWLIRWHEYEAVIEGHADEPGSDDENIILSARRAEAVRQRLVTEGVEARRISIVPLGRAVRIAVCADSDCQAQNRRAVTQVLAAGSRDRLGLGPEPLAGPDPIAAPALLPARHVEVPEDGHDLGAAR